MMNEQLVDNVQRYAAAEAWIESLPDNQMRDSMRQAIGQVTQQYLRNEVPQDWQIFSLRDAYAPRDPLQFIVNGLLTLPSLSVVYGGPGSLKSFLLADLCACVAGNRSWLAPLAGQGGTAFSVLQAPVLWCDFDNGTRRTHERFAALGRAYNLPADIPLYYASMPSPWLDASRQDSVGALADRITSRDVKLVIIDNLGVTIGGADENSPEMARVMANLRWVVESTGSALVVIHHQRKSNGQVTRAGDNLRGHTSIEAALDLALHVEREGGSTQIEIRSTKTRDVEVAPFGAQFTFEHKDQTNELAAARFFGLMVEDKISDAAVESAIIQIVQNVRPINQSDLVEKVKASNIEAGTNRIRAAADRLVTEKKLTCTGGKGTSKLYDRP